MKKAMRSIPLLENYAYLVLQWLGNPVVLWAGGIGIVHDLDNCADCRASLLHSTNEGLEQLALRSKA